MMFVKKICNFFTLLLLPAAFFAQSKAAPAAVDKTAPLIVYNEDFAKGEELFTLNKPEEAIPFLETALKADGVDPLVYVYLGVAYYQTGDYQKSLDICVVGLTKEGADSIVLAFNAGNSAYAMGNYARAEACYTIALKADEQYASAYLNRANAQLKQDHLEAARENYESFLDKAPNDPQAPQIQHLLELLDEEIARRLREKPELILPEDLNVENAGMDRPEPEFVGESEAPQLPPEPKSGAGERTDEEHPAPFTEPKEAVFGQELLSGDDVAVGAVPEDQMTSENSLPQAAAGGEAVAEEDAASPALPQEPDRVTDSETGEVVELPALPLPETEHEAADKESAPAEPVTEPQPALPPRTGAEEQKHLEAVESESDELPPSDYWD